MTTTYAVLSDGLEKRFGDVRALRGLDLAVPRGTVCEILGPNGYDIVIDACERWENRQGVGG